MSQPQQPQPNSTSRAQPQPAAVPSSWQEILLKSARASLRQVLTRHSLYHAQLQPELQDELNLLAASRDKLDQAVIQIAVFGLVSRGKSAVLNALLGQKVFLTGPLNGVTRWPRSVRWSPAISLPVATEATHPFPSKVQIELIDTPGLDEVEGQVHAQMAREVTYQADLILFVISGDLTRTELQALTELRETQKPLILVFNKIDLYPGCDRQTIYQHIRDQRLRQLISPREIVMTAAEPAPLQVRVEWPDGRFTYEWESPPAQVDQLKQKILEILNREGKPLLALNALFQATQVETAISTKVFSLKNTQAQALIWRFVRFKALAVALNPVALLDLLGGAISDLLLIRALARLYGFPITSFEAGKLWSKVFFSTGALVAGELGSSFALGLGKSGVAFTEGVGGVPTYVGAAIAQAGFAGYGTYVVGQAAQYYLIHGCTWGSLGPSTVIQDILTRVEPDTILYQVRQELQDKLSQTEKTLSQ